MKKLPIIVLFLLIGGCGQDDMSGSSEGVGASGSVDSAGEPSGLGGSAALSGSGSTGEAAATTTDSETANTAGGYDDCVETVTELELDEATPDGLSAQEVLTFVEGSKTQTLVWSGASPPEVAGTTTEITLELEPSSTARFIEREGEPGTVAYYLYCTDRLELDVTATIRTEDGALDEQSPGVLMIGSSERAELSVSLDAASLGGTLDLGIEPPTTGEVNVMATFTPRPAGSSRVAPVVRL